MSNGSTALEICCAWQSTIEFLYKKMIGLPDHLLIGLPCYVFAEGLGKQPVKHCLLVRYAYVACGRLTLNHMAYSAGKKSKVKTVPTPTPPIRTKASAPQKLESVSGMNASIAAMAVNITGRARRTVDSTMAS